MESGGYLQLLLLLSYKERIFNLLLLAFSLFVFHYHSDQIPLVINSFRGLLFVFYNMMTVQSRTNFIGYDVILAHRVGDGDG